MRIIKLDHQFAKSTIERMRARRARSLDAVQNEFAAPAASTAAVGNSIQIGGGRQTRSILHEALRTGGRLATTTHKVAFVGNARTLTHTHAL